MGRTPHIRLTGREVNFYDVLVDGNGSYQQGKSADNLYKVREGGRREGREGGSNTQKTEVLGHARHQVGHENGSRMAPQPQP